MKNYKVHLIQTIILACIATNINATNIESQQYTKTLEKGVSNSTLNKKQVWTINRNDHDLQTLLNRWCNQVGWQLDWQVNATFPIEFNWTINSNFNDAINQVLVATQHTDVPLKAIMYSSNRVLKIVKNQ